jgi:hypothetical protein
MQKSLDRKLADIHANPSTSKAFIIADAKDADMAYGLAAPGKSPEYYGQEGRFRTLAEYRQLMRDVVHQGLVDIMLMSASSNEVLTIQERLFDNSHITPAARGNDTSDIFAVRGGNYVKEPSRPFRSATIDQIQCGKVDCEPQERKMGADLALYSMTFNNRVDLDRDTLERYREFRIEAERKGFRHFLEVFDPNIPGAVDPAQLGHFINDHIARTLAGVPSKGRPIFLKIVYHGPREMEALARYAPELVPGVLGGAAGTTFDAFNLLYEAKKYGARAALFGRKINNAELVFIHTNGSPLRGIPKRPIIEPAIEEKTNKEPIAEELKEAASAALDADRPKTLKHLKRAGMTAQNRVRAWFTDPRNGWAPNAPSTIAQKDSDKPMIDTAELRKDISYVVTES